MSHGSDNFQSSPKLSCHQKSDLTSDFTIERQARTCLHVSSKVFVGLKFAFCKLSEVKLSGFQVIVHLQLGNKI